jgi:ABC-type Na+ efflux pump permease subunit
MGESTDPIRRQVQRAVGGSDGDLVGGNEERVEELRADIDRTRSEMSETIDELQERLSPENIKQQAVESTREVTVARAQRVASTASETAKTAGSTLARFAKQNSLLAGLGGALLGWLVIRGLRGSDQDQD